VSDNNATQLVARDFITRVIQEKLSVSDTALERLSLSVSSLNSRELYSLFHQHFLYLISNYTFSILVSFFNLNSQPNDLFSGSLAYILFTPTPSELFQWVPYSLSFSSLLEIYPQLNVPRSRQHLNYYPLIQYSKKGVRSALARVTAHAPPVEGRAGAKTNLTIEDAVNAASGEAEMYSMLLALDKSLPGNDWEATVVTSLLLLHHASANAWRIAGLLLTNRGLLSLDFLTFSKFCKELHTVYRTTRLCPLTGEILSNEQLRQVYGVDVIVGRNEKFKFDADAEIVMRMTDPTHRGFLPSFGALPEWASTPEFYNSALSDALRLAVRESVGFEGYTSGSDTGEEKFGSTRPLKLETFHDWYERRMYWAAAGGAPGATIRWEDGETSERLNKRGALFALTEQHFLDVVQQPGTPRLFSKAAPKFENGKLRAIWNTSIEHYIFQAYILDQFESSQISGTWNSASNNAADELAARATRLEALSHPEDQTGLMWDFSDFNVNHTKLSMKSLFAQIGAVLLEHGASDAGEEDTRNAKDDIVRYLKWVVTAKDNMFLFNPESGFGAEVERSLQSGERATSIVNTFENRAYYHLHNKYCNMVLGRPLLNRTSWHQGDDVFLLVKNISDGVLASTIYNLLGFAGQTYKITLDYTSRGEFLRLAYDPDTSTVAGYPMRTYAGLIGGEFFREVVADPGDRAMAFLDQVSDANRRGCIITQQFLDVMIKRNAHITYTDEHKKVHRITPQLDLLLTPAILGGYGTSSLPPSNTFSRPLYTRALGAIAPGVTTVSGSVPLMRPIAIGIPSFGGKSTLAKKHPTLFCDPDDFGDPSLVSKMIREAKRTGKWDQLNAYHRSLPYPRDKMLLTWGPSTTPGDYSYLGAHLVQPLRPGREWVANLAAIEQAKVRCPSVNTMQWYPSYEDREVALLALIQRQNVIFPFSERLPASTRSYASFLSESRPMYIPPRVNLSLLTELPAAKALPDVRVLAAHGGERVIKRALAAIASDALSGAYPGSALSQSIADYAAKLDSYLLSVRPGPYVSPPKFSPQLFDGLAAYVAPTLATMAKGDYSAIGRVSTAEPGRHVHVPLPPNRYGAIHALVPIMGLSAFTTLKILLELLPAKTYPGTLGKIYSILAQYSAAGFGTIKHRFSTANNMSSSYPVSIIQLTEFIHGIVGLPEYAHFSDHPRSSLLASYLLGECSLLPSPSSNVSPQLLTIVRHLALSWVEVRHPELFEAEPLFFAFFLSACEYHILLLAQRYYSKTTRDGSISIVRILS
jgi:hypothetical protein